MTSRRFKAGLALAALLPAACSGAVQSAETVSAPRGTPVAESTTSTSSLPALIRSDLVDRELPAGSKGLGLVTSTGVPVSVLGRAEGTMVVRTPCGAIDFVSGGTQLRAVDVVLDPGHGGPISTGAVGPNGLVESDLNLLVANEAQAELARRGIVAASTRSANYATTLEVRAAFADDLGAQLMVSIHHNAPNGSPSDSPGTEVYVQSGSAGSLRLGGLLQSYVGEALSQFEDVRWTSAADAGVMRVLNSAGADAYGVLRHPETPTALVEIGYISNSDEANLFATAEYVKVAGTALADSVEAFLTSVEPGSGYVGKPRVFNPRGAVGDDACVDPELE